jgi:hypothetical protein
MSKILQASCVGGVVTASGVPVPAATVLSEGVGSSSGVLLLDEDKATYVAKTSPDLKTTLTKIISVLGQLTTALTLIDTKVMVTTCGAGPGTAGPTPLAASNITQIASIQAELTILKESLK